MHVHPSWDFLGLLSQLCFPAHFDQEYTGEGSPLFLRRCETAPAGARWPQAPDVLPNVGPCWAKLKEFCFVPEALGPVICAVGGCASYIFSSDCPQVYSQITRHLQVISAKTLLTMPGGPMACCALSSAVIERTSGAPCRPGPVLHRASRSSRPRANSRSERQECPGLFRIESSHS